MPCKGRGQVDDLRIVLVFEHSHDEIERLSGEIPFQRLFQFQGRGGIVRPIDDDRGIAAQRGEAAAPGSVQQPLAHLLVGERVAKLSQCLHALERKGGVFDLIAARKRNGNIFPRFIGEGLSLRAVVHVADLALVHHLQGAVLLFASILDDLCSLALLLRGNHHGIRLDDTSLLRGDLRERIAQKVCVIHADGGNNLHQRGGDDVGGIQKAAAAHFQRHDVAALFLKIEKRQGGLYLKDGGAGKARFLHVLGSGGNGRHMAGERLFFDVLPVHLNALPVGKQRGRDVASGTVARAGQDRGKIGQNRSFSVGTGNVNEL